MTRKRLPRREPPGPTRCTAITRKNGKCKRWALHGKDVCLTHDPEAVESRTRSQANLELGRRPKNEPLARPEVDALVAEIAKIESGMNPLLRDEDGRARQDLRDLVDDYAEVRLEIVELRKQKRTVAIQRRLDSALKRRDQYRDQLGLGGPETQKVFASLEAQNKAVRAKQGQTQNTSEERRWAVAILLRDAGLLPTREEIDAAEAEEEEED
jgi:hypothetical protein